MLVYLRADIYNSYLDPLSDKLIPPWVLQLIEKKN